MTRRKEGSEEELDRLMKNSREAYCLRKYRLSNQSPVCCNLKEYNCLRIVPHTVVILKRHVEVSVY